MFSFIRTLTGKFFQALEEPATVLLEHLPVKLAPDQFFVYYVLMLYLLK